MSKSSWFFLLNSYLRENLVYRKFIWFQHKYILSISVASLKHENCSWNVWEQFSHFLLEIRVIIRVIILFLRQFELPFSCFSPELGGHGHEVNGHRCPCPRHGHGRGMDTKFLEKRDVDMDMAMKKSVKRVVDMDMATKNPWNVALTWTWSRSIWETWRGLGHGHEL